MLKKNSNKPIKLDINSPLIINNLEITLSEPRLELESDKNLMVHSENQTFGVAFVRAILGLEKLSSGLISIKMEEKELIIGKKKNVDFSKEKIKMAYVSENGADFCNELTIKENIELIRDTHDQGFNNRIQQFASDFSVKENLDDFPDSISVKRRKIFSIIRAWGYLPDIMVYSNPLENLDDLSSIEIMQNLAVPKENSAWLSIVYVPSIGEFSNVLDNFHLVEIVQSKPEIQE